jgi:CRP/FNR family transcriptional regulator, cyclic AMP receptor protein
LIWIKTARCTGRDNRLASQPGKGVHVVASSRSTRESTSKLELVRNSALAVELTGDQCAVLAEVMSVRELADGEILVKQGASDNHLYAVVSGALAVARQVEAGGEWVTLHVLTKGDLAGELGFMDGRPHYAALRASGPTQVLCLQREKLESLLSRDPVVVYRVMRAIFRVVHVILNRMAMQTSELTNYLYKVHGKY